MPFLLTVKYDLSLWRKVINADTQDVLHSIQQRLSSCYGMKIFFINLLLKGCPSVRRNRHLQIYILRRLIANMPAALYQHALALVSTGQCSAAMIRLDLAIIRRHSPSRALLAHMLIGGREGVAKDRNRAVELAKEGAHLGCHHCQGVLAKCYFWGYGIQRDVALSLKLVRNSSDTGSRYGQVTLGIQHYSGLGGLAMDNVQALAFYRLAAAQSLDDAHYFLGYMYFYGRSINQDRTEALKWFQLAANQGHPLAMFYVAFCHHHGQGVVVDVEEAILWYRRALAAGHILAATKLRELRA